MTDVYVSPPPKIGLFSSPGNVFNEFLMLDALPYKNTLAVVTFLSVVYMEELVWYMFPGLDDTYADAVQFVKNTLIAMDFILGSFHGCNLYHVMIGVGYIGSMVLS